MEETNDGTLGGTLHFEEVERIIVCFFRKTFGSETVDNFQKLLNWQCYRGRALPVQDKLYMRRSTVRRSSRGARGARRPFCTYLTNLCGYVDQLLSRIERIRLSVEPIVKINPLPSISPEEQTMFSISD